MRPSTRVQSYGAAQLVWLVHDGMSSSIFPHACRTLHADHDETHGQRALLHLLIPSLASCAPFTLGA